MKIGQKSCDQIIIIRSDGEVVAVVSDNEIIERNGYKVTISQTSA